MRIINILFLIFFIPLCIQGMEEKITRENFVPELRKKFSEYVNKDGYLKTPSPTLAYIFHKGSEKLIKNLLGDDRVWQLCLPQPLLDYAFNLSVRVIKKEIEYCDKGYFVFYHGQKLDNRLFQDLKEIFYEIKEKKELKDFVFVRQFNSELLEKINKYNNTNQYLHKFFDKYGSDDYNETSETLLPANYCFFGNSATPGESSFAYSILRMLFPTKFILYHALELSVQEGYLDFDDLIPKIEELIEILNNEKDKNYTDNLLQIFLPQKLSHLIYFALPYGDKYNCNCIKTVLTHYVFGKKINCNCDFNKLCQRYQLQPQISIKTLDAEQVRILLQPKYFMNPDSGIKIFRYANETEQLKKYHDKIKELRKFICESRQNLKPIERPIYSKL